MTAAPTRQCEQWRCCFVATAAGEAAAADAVEAAIEAAHGAGGDTERGGDEWQQRLAAAGAAC
eukprot:4146424-Pleurochrysis_carterae.AAC.1